MGTDDNSGGGGGEANFVEVVHGAGTVTYLNLDCQVCHFYDQVAQICSIPPDSKVDLATDRGRLALLPELANSSQPVTTVLKSRSVMVPVLLMPLALGDGFDSETASVAPPSRPSSTRSTSGRRKKEEEEDVVSMSVGRYRFSPLLQADVIASRFPQFEIHPPGKTGSLKKSASRRISRVNLVKSKSKHPSITS
ncbi:hypothetical protein PTSG_03708 [Salpingoeca rosetta]|uniref:Uncharacterized protein n=1 Tax=Salpingoeca rosetta (strain ATCC 50818 / BSB-021) TaxID=946362 RepID=F2U6C9_SALR5|nr:uncharacterized protein PTSG_03708 [Salpingoeca rosetta]EGD83070.1 hypothetical protein PTSG_03708 [Salpingoeca rosetta]|eukprot:XP_004995434.1 hypothetical protein PTSG_03708 [Salpingoeca rosetta]